MGFFSSIGGIIGGLGGLALGPLGAVVGSGLGGALGGAVDANQANKKAEGYYNQQMDFARQQAQFQQDYAKHVMEWRVEDAKNAGVHPMAALGISNPSYSPVSAPSAPQIYDSGNFDTGSTFGQSLNRASLQAKTMEQQQQAADLGFQQIGLQNKGLELDNQYKALQVAQLASELQRNAASSAPAPSLDGKVPGGIDGQTNSFSNFGDSPSNLYSITRVGDILLTVLNPDIADSLTESQLAHASATFAREIEAERNPQLYLDAFKHLSASEQKAVLEKRAIFEYVPGVGGYMLTYPRWRASNGLSAGGKLRY